MQISSARLEECRNVVRITADVQIGTYLSPLWYEVPREFADRIVLERYDAFAIALALECMNRQEPLHIEGVISESLLSGLRYYNHVMRMFFPNLKIIDITAAGQEQFDLPLAGREVGAGFSAGVDAMCTAYDNFENQRAGYRIDRLVYVNVGSHGGKEKGRQFYRRRLQLVQKAADAIGLPLLAIDSNLSDFLSAKYDYSYVPFIISCVQLLQKQFHTYMIASSNAYADVCPDGSTPLSDHLLSTDALRVVHDGAQYNRLDKVKRLADWDVARRHLNVCRSPQSDLRNCSRCSKCAWVMLAADMLDLREPYSEAFDFSVFEETKSEFVSKKMERGTASPNYFWRELVRYAEESGYPLFPDQSRAFATTVELQPARAEIVTVPAKRRMSVFWRQDANFGDRVTEWILRTYGFEAEYRRAGDAELVGAGSLLQLVPEDFKGMILGTGFQEEHQSRVFPQAQFLAVRGRLSAERSRAPRECALGDPGLLVRYLLPEPPAIRHTMAIVPHYADQTAPHLQAIYKRYAKRPLCGNESDPSEIVLVNVRADPHKALELIAASQYVLSSSLYGVIAAEALGKPCRWLILSRHVPGGVFKFQDYYSAFDREERPLLLDGTETLHTLISATRRPSSQVAERAAKLYELFQSLG